MRLGGGSVKHSESRNRMLSEKEQIAATTEPPQSDRTSVVDLGSVRTCLDPSLPYHPKQLAFGWLLRPALYRTTLLRVMYPSAVSFWASRSTSKLFAEYERPAASSALSMRDRPDKKVGALFSRSTL